MDVASLSIPNQVRRGRPRREAKLSGSMLLHVQASSFKPQYVDSTLNRARYVFNLPIPSYTNVRYMSYEHESAALEREIAVFNYFITAASRGSVLLRNRRDSDMTRFEPHGRRRPRVRSIIRCVYLLSISIFITLEMTLDAST